MSNVLYIGPYREFSGMGNAARQYIKALLMAGHNIGIRPIYNIFKPYPEKDIDYEILELEQNIAKPYDIIVQHCYPHQLCYDNRFQKNIGIIHLESSGYYSNISDNINIMDEIIVGSNFLKSSLSNHCAENRVRVVPEPIDYNKILEYKQNNKKHKTNNYTFYAIADLVDRKNIYDIVKAFAILYKDSDNVDLVLKLKTLEDDPSSIDKIIEYEFNKIYSTIRNNYIKKPKIVFGHTDYNAILYVHHNNDCFINISSGESFGYSTLEAMCFNNQIIVNENIGSTEIIGDECGLINTTTRQRCFDSDRLFGQYNSFHQHWQKPNLESLVANMSRAHNESSKDKENRITKQNSQLQKYSIDNISNMLHNL